MTGLRRHARIVVTSWVMCVIPLLTATLAYMLLHFPAINRALWRSASWQAHLMATALTGHRYAMATIDAIGAALLILPLAGSLYIVTGLARRATTMGLRWSAWPTRAPRPGRRSRPGLLRGARRLLDPARPIPRLVARPADTPVPVFLRR